MRSVPVHKNTPKKIQRTAISHRNSDRTLGNDSNGYHRAVARIQGYNAILVITEYLTKMKILVPCTTEITSAGVAVILRRELFRKHGLPKKVISDRGSNFVSHFMQALYKLLGIKGAPSTAYHPQTDGMNERSHQETEQYLAAFTNYHQDDWSD